MSEAELGEPVGADPRRIEDRQLEDADATTYYVECCVYLDEFLGRRPELAGQEIRQKVRDLLEWLCAPSDERNPEARAGRGDRPSPLRHDRQGCLLPPWPGERAPVSRGDSPALLKLRPGPGEHMAA